MIFLLNYIWSFIMIASIICGFVNGRSAEVSTAFFEGSTECISFILRVGAIMVAWQGLLSVMEKSSLSKKIAGFMSPVITRLFSDVKKGSRAEDQIAKNISANMLGLSNAATPTGMEAMKELAKKSQNGIATGDMCLLAVINSASLQIIPSTLIAMRSAEGSASPGEITIPIWIVSSLTLIFAITLAKIMERRGKK